MANEATEVELDGQVKGGAMRFACADGVGIEKGTLLKLSGARTVAASTAAGTTEVFGGIAAEEKVASDGATTIGVYRCGVYKIGCGACAPGALVRLSGANFCSSPPSAADLLSGAVVGRALETSTTTGTPIQVEIGVY